MQLQRFKAPLIGLLITLVAILEVGGISHAFRAHGRRDGIVAIALPPFAWYRAAESFRSHGPRDAAIMAESDSGRRDLVAEMTLPASVWTTLLAGIEKEKNHTFTTTLKEVGVSYSTTATAEPQGAAILMIKGPKKDDAEMILTDSDRDQTPERLLIRKTAEKGKPPTGQTIMLADFQNGEESQFLLAWSLSWATIANQRGLATP